ncbi:MAG: glycosyltransferase [Candidatus Diapherotrites archaeon]|nr:glycosyltransferase [Candidatus Diapherotrites archaeon]
MGKLLLYGFHFFLISGFVFCLFLINLFLQATNLFHGEQFNEIYLIVFLSFLISGIFLCLIDFALNFISRKPRKLRFNPFNKPRIIVGMTAFNDEGVIGNAVNDFKLNSLVSEVIVVDNNSKDNTFEEAKQAGAKVVKESVQGYGACCMRALKEARKNADLIVLVEGDMTFSSTDLKKLLAYIENADMVVGTRTTTELCAPDSQMNWFLQYGNIFIAKLIQLRFWGKLRLTDVGCTFRVIRPEALDKIMPLFKVTKNHFSPHMILQALKSDLKVIEVPVTLKKRGGESKGVGSSISKGFITGLHMWKEILFT